MTPAGWLTFCLGLLALLTAGVALVLALRQAPHRLSAQQDELAAAAKKTRGMVEDVLTAQEKLEIRVVGHLEELEDLKGVIETKRRRTQKMAERAAPDSLDTAVEQARRAGWSV